MISGFAEILANTQAKNYIMSKGKRFAAVMLSITLSLGLYSLAAKTNTISILPLMGILIAIGSIGLVIAVFIAWLIEPNG